MGLDPNHNCFAAVVWFYYFFCIIFENKWRLHMCNIVIICTFGHFFRVWFCIITVLDGILGRLIAKCSVTQSSSFICAFRSRTGFVSLFTLFSEMSCLPKLEMALMQLWQWTETTSFRYLKLIIHYYLQWIVYDRINKNIEMCSFMGVKK